MDHAPDDLSGQLSGGPAAWPALDVDPGRWSEFAARARSAGANVTARAADLYLACACVHRVPGALEAFRDTYDQHITAILGRFDAERGLRDEAYQLLHEQLFVAAPGVEPKIGQYRGRGDLLSFIRVIAIRAALGLLRKRRGPEGDDDDLIALPAGDDDPELQYLKELYRHEFKAAFAAALGELSPRERTLLRYHVVDGLSVDKIGAIYGQHRSTAARQVAKAREALVAGTRRALMRKLEIPADELDSVMRLVRSSVDLSARRLLS